MKKISIIITTYNRENTILMTLDSIPIRNDLEIILIDDCSNDDTFSLVEAYNRLSIKRIRNEKNLGEALTRNIGFDHATGEYLYAVDGDDWLFPIEFNNFIDNFLYKTNSMYDIIRVPIKSNYGEMFNLDGKCCAFNTMLIKRSFMGNIRCQDIKYISDKIVNEELKKLNPKTIVYPYCFYHYNYPNKNSLTWEKNHKDFE